MIRSTTLSSSDLTRGSIGHHQGSGFGKTTKIVTTTTRLQYLTFLGTVPQCLTVSPRQVGDQRFVIHGGVQLKGDAFRLALAGCSSSCREGVVGGRGEVGVKDGGGNDSSSKMVVKSTVCRRVIGSSGMVAGSSLSLSLRTGGAVWMHIGRGAMVRCVVWDLFVLVSLHFASRCASLFSNDIVQRRALS